VDGETEVVVWRERPLGEEVEPWTARVGVGSAGDMRKKFGSEDGKRKKARQRELDGRLRQTKRMERGRRRRVTIDRYLAMAKGGKRIPLSMLFVLRGPA